jgi:hypothetical protein
MADIQRKAIKLFKQVDDLTKDPEYETYYTSPYISLRDTREAWVLNKELEDPENGLSQDERIDKLVDFVANRAFKGQLTKEDIEDRLVGGLQELNAVLAFVAFGQDIQAKKSQAKKN